MHFGQRLGGATYFSTGQAPVYAILLFKPLVFQRLGGARQRLGGATFIVGGATFIVLELLGLARPRLGGASFFISPLIGGATLFV